MSMRNDHIKKTMSRISGGGLLLLSNIALASVGFSSWVLTAANAEADIKAEVGNVIDLQSIFDIKEPKIFSYNPYGIIRDETIVTNGYVYFPVKICSSNENFDSLLSSKDHSLTFDFEIENTGRFPIYDYLKKSDDGTYKSFYSVALNDFSNDCTIANPFSLSNDVASFDFTIGNTNNLFDSEAFFLNIRLEFAFDNYDSDTYSSLFQNGLSFSIGAKVVVE